ncbi:MAG: hypothetical protein ACTHN3_06050 [Solirubrobacterales bacterium]
MKAKPRKIDPEQVVAKLESALGKESVTPALRKVLKNHNKIAEWLAASADNAAAFKADPAKALNQAFPDLELPSSGGIESRVPLTVAGLHPTVPDPATLDFFREVWRYVCSSDTNANAFNLDQEGTIRLLGRERPAAAVQRVVDAFARVQLGMRSTVGFSRLTVEEALHQIFDPVGPVESPEGLINRLRTSHPGQDGP